ncbi:hypothetical protein IFM12276_50550 [Nocardia sputorum]|uniref:Creatinase N-terminal domain-containing protein n=1 Tax=Nocardia sputorum TaxID=2984338 RepID=A0ABM8D3T0_9NOCA|nr:hypothetical protein IFM12276_50550 [Nocardia sputorum]
MPLRNNNIAYLTGFCRSNAQQARPNPGAATPGARVSGVSGPGGRCGSGPAALIAMRFDCNEIAGTMSEVAAYGTAGLIKPVTQPS